MKSSQKKEFAKQLYIANELSAKLIAQKVGITRQTLSRWIIAEKWDKLKKNLINTKREQLEFLLDQLNSLKASIKSRPEQERFITPKEADTISKITSSIERLENKSGVGEAIHWYKHLTSRVSNIDVKHAQLIVEYCDMIVKEELGK